jgi:hypothetical protein
MAKSTSEIDKTIKGIKKNLKILSKFGQTLNPANLELKVRGRVKTEAAKK